MIDLVINIGIRFQKNPLLFNHLNKIELSICRGKHLNILTTPLPLLAREGIKR